MTAEQIPADGRPADPILPQRSMSRRWVPAGLVAVAVVMAILLVGTWTGVVPWPQLLGRCPWGRTCVPEAGISFVLPSGWRTTSPEDNLFAAVTGDDRVALLVVDGGKLLDELPADLDAVQRAGLARLKAGGFSHFASTAADRVTLQTGPAVRISYTRSKCFIFCLHSAVTEYWVFVDGRLICIAYVEGYGESTSSPPPSYLSDELQAILGSLELLSTGST